jgi:SAM-dependent methyltransferase
MVETSAADVDYNRIWQQVYGEMDVRGPVHRHLARVVDPLLSSLEYTSVLDVGCGVGHSLPLLCKGRKLADVTGVDISTWAIEQATKYFPGTFKVLDVEKESLPGTWDLVHASLLLEHLRDDVAALRNIRVMVKRYLLVSTIAGDFARYRRWDEQVGHVRNYAVGELEKKLENAGFQVRQAIYWGFPFYSPLARTLQNYARAQNQLTVTGRILATLLYYLYFFNLRRRGDLLVVLAECDSSRAG